MFYCSKQWEIKTKMKEKHLDALQRIELKYKNLLQSTVLFCLYVFFPLLNDQSLTYLLKPILF